MKRSTFFSQIANRKAQGIKRKPKKPPRWLLPINQERQYRKELFSLTDELRRLIKEYLIPQIPGMISEVETKMPNDRQDNFIDRLQSIILFIRKAIQPKINQTILGADVSGVAIANYNKIQSQKLNESIFGIDIFVDEPWLSDQLRLFSSQNAQLITSLPDDELDRVAQSIERGLQQGLRFTSISKELQKSFGITERRAKLIARDQTAKLNSSLTRLRQEQIGITKFEWSTSGDERVRHSHALMDGKLCSWSDPNIYYKDGKKVPRPAGATRTFVGSDCNCRCVALPYLNDLMKL